MLNISGCVFVVGGRAGGGAVLEVKHWHGKAMSEPGW